MPRKGEIIEAVKTSVTQKRIVETKYPSIEKKYLLEWFEQAMFKNLIITDEIFKNSGTAIWDRTTH